MKNIPKNIKIIHLLQLYYLTLENSTFPLELFVFIKDLLNFSIKLLKFFIYQGSPDPNFSKYK